MRRDTRKHQNSENKKNILYIGGSILGLGILAFVITFVLYGNKMEEQSNIDTGRIAALIQESDGDTETISIQMGKSVEESKNEVQNTTNEGTSKSTNTTTNQTTPKNNTVKAVGEKKTTTNNKEQTNQTQSSNTKTEGSKTEETKKEALTFIKPAEGEISKEYAKDNLVYSETLEEWTTHLGIDIKAEKTSVVKASASGKIKSIKNDPRYGLSIVIEHQDGYETLYANLLSSEFVQVGEEVKQGQSIGTVGDTATFEIIDPAHLHFEIMKDGESVDPMQLIK